MFKPLKSLEFTIHTTCKTNNFILEIKTLSFTKNFKTAINLQKKILGGEKI